MKKLMIFSILIATFFLGCKTQQKSTGYSYDDVYSSGSKPAMVASTGKIQNTDLSASPSVASADTSSLKSKTAAKSQVDYSDNSYSARIKRFNGKNPGLDYSSEYYTKPTDSTSSSGGSSPDVNLFVGSSWDSPFCDPYSSFGLGFGWGDFGFGYGYPYYWGSPYFSSYYGYWGNPYWGGEGWHHHYWDWGFNNRYYGQRTVTSRGGATARATAITTNKTIPGRTNINPVSPDKQRYNYVRSTSQGNTRTARNIQDNKAGSSRTYVQHQQPSPRYVRPGSQTQMGRTNAQAYSSPAYRQPKSSQEYINPHPQQGRPASASENYGRTGNYNNPNSGRRYSSPTYNGGNSRVYSNPSGSSRFYNTPSRSYSSGGYGSSRSSGSGYSSPSHSYSAPSHSGGGGGGGGRSSGGGSGGGHGGGGGGHR
jgi:hypothetical protein